MKIMTESDWNSIWENHSDDLTLRLKHVEQCRIMALITNCFPAGAEVLDLGSGDGELATRLKEAGHTVTCVDISSVALEKAKEKDLDTRQADLLTINFNEWQKDSYDAVVLSHLIDHLTEPQQVIKLAVMVLKPGGFMAISNYRTNRKQEQFDRERYPTRTAIDDEAIINLLRTTVHGRVRLEKHCGENVALIFYGEPPLPTLSLCLMAWNEEPFIRKCIESVPYDELIVGIDDDTSDRTFEIAQEYVGKAPLSGEVYYFPHMIAGTETYDFSARRNEGFEKTHCDWIIQIDAHEYMNPESQRLKEELRWAGEKEVFHIMMHRSSQTFHVPHIWKNDGSYCFKHAVHNILARKDGQNIPTWKRALMQGAHCYHEWTDTKSDERAGQRNVGNVPGLIAEAEANPDSERPWFFIGNAYLGMNEFDKAYDAYDECLKRAKTGQEELIYQCYLLQGKILINADKFKEAREKLLGIAVYHPERNEHLIYTADAYASEKDFEKAKIFYMMASHFKPPISCMFVEEDLYGYWLAERLYMVMTELGEYKSARTMLIDMVEKMPRQIYEEKKKETVQRYAVLEEKLTEQTNTSRI